MAKTWFDLFKEQVDDGEWRDAVKGAFPTKLKPNERFAPEISRVFRAFALLKPSQVKYLVIGLDPYPDKNKATGVAFLVPEGTEPPQSLKNLTGVKGGNTQRSGLFPADEKYLEKWARDEGVLLINAALTIPANGESEKHLGHWEEFTKAIVRFLNKQPQNVEIIALGGVAANVAKKALINCCIHPSRRNSNQSDFDIFWQRNGPLSKKGGGRPPPCCDHAVTKDKH